MEKTLLLAGRNYASSIQFCSQIKDSGRSVLFTGTDDEASQNNDENLLVWHSASPISSRSLIAKVDAKCTRLDEVVLYFDEVEYLKDAQRLSIKECSRVLNEISLGFQYLTLELVSKFDKKIDKGLFPPKLIFIDRKASLQKEISMPHIAAAEASFSVFAERCASYYHSRESFEILLVQTDENNELSKTDAELAKWLCSYISELDEKGMQNTKQSVTWIKPGAKANRVFSLFGR